MSSQALYRSWGCRPANSAGPAVSVALPAARPCPQALCSGPGRAPAAHSLPRLHQWAAAASPAARRRGGRAAAILGSADAAPSDSDADAGQERRFVRALLLAWFASQNRSLFAARCLVEVVIEMYREGVTVDDVAVMLSLASLQQGGTLLQPVDQDALLSYVAVVMMALEMVGVPLLPEGQERRQRKEQGGGGQEDLSSMSQGLKGFVRVAVDQFLAGTDLYRLQLQQSMAGDSAGEGDAAGVSPAVRMLQQNTRLVIITLEVVRDSGIPTVVPLDQPRSAGAAEEEAAAAEPAAGSAAAAAPGAEQAGQQEPEQGQPAGNTQAQQEEGQQEVRRSAGVVPGFALACDSVRLASCDSKEARQRAAAVRLLISFMGAAQGWLYSAWDFVEQCTECYSYGWTADEVFSRLNDEEFAQSGGMPGISLARQAGGPNPNVSALVFARWISLCYITLAQLRVVFPGALGQDAWAWVSGAAAMHDGSESTTLEAYGLADFVVHTIRNEEAKEAATASLLAASRGSASSSSGSGSSDGGEEEREPPVEGVLSRRPPLAEQPREGFVVVQDEGLLATSPTALLMSQQISLIQMTRQLMLQERARVEPPPA